MQSITWLIASLILITVGVRMIVTGWPKDAWPRQERTETS